MMREVNRIACVDLKGQSETLVEYRKVISFVPLNGRKEETLGATEYRTTGNLWANPNDDGSFTLQDGRAIRRLEKQ